MTITPRPNSWLPDRVHYPQTRVQKTLDRYNFYLVAMTGYGQPADREKALAAGFDRHMVKPGDPEELQEILANGAAAH